MPRAVQKPFDVLILVILIPFNDNNNVFAIHGSVPELPRQHSYTVHRFIARVKVPTQKDIEEALLRRKKQELLEMYAIDADDLDQLEKEAKQPAPPQAGPALAPAAAESNGSGGDPPQQ